MSRPNKHPQPERRFIEDLQRHPRFGIAFVIGCVVLITYGVARAFGWSP